MKKVSSFEFGSVGLILIVLSAGGWPAVASAGETGYRVEYDYPGHPSTWYGQRGPVETWLDYAPRTTIDTQLGSDFEFSYLPGLVGFAQGAPVERTVSVHSLFEFRYRRTGDCTIAIISPCGPTIFADRFEQ